MALRSSVSTAAPIRHSSSGAPPRRTPLYDVHINHGGEVVDFSGWALPVRYAGAGVVAETALCRNGAALFDVSHMGQVIITGPGREAFWERVSTADIQAASMGQTKYNVLCAPHGGALDDAMVTREANQLCVVLNAACYETDMINLKNQIVDFPGVKMQNLYDTHALAALQGPKSAEVLSAIMDPIEAKRLCDMSFMTRDTFKIGGVEGISLTRSGYTGEDGYEMSIPIPHAVALIEKILSVPGAGPAGLGSRDTLRLEAALTLYGNDMSEEIDLAQGLQAWCITKRRRAEGGFVGAGPLLKTIRDGPKRKRIGMVITGAPARHGATIHTADGTQVGVVTSGGPSPTNGNNIALGLVPSELAAKGNKLQVSVRGKLWAAEIVSMPFVPHQYKR